MLMRRVSDDWNMIHASLRDADVMMLAGEPRLERRG
jgi:hypothetical protein